MTDDAALAALDALSLRLRDAHLALVAWSAPEEQKASVRRRLLAISDGAKRNTTRAAQRLELLMEELPAP